MVLWCCRLQSLVHDEVLHFRVDTRDSLSGIESSFLVGGEVLVLEHKKVQSPSRRVSDVRPEDVGAEQGWTLAHIKGPELWAEIEVCIRIHRECANAMLVF